MLGRALKREKKRAKYTALSAGMHACGLTAHRELTALNRQIKSRAVIFNSIYMRCVEIIE